MSFSLAAVIATEQITRRLRRITLHIDDPDALQLADAADSAVGVYFGASTNSPGRNYSVRHQDGDCIDLDVLLHATGTGTDWARTTRAGDRVGLDHARSWYAPDPASAWRLLVADLSGLPAAARIIEEHPAGSPLTAIVEVADRDDLDYLPAHPDLRTVPIVGTGNGLAPSRLADAVRTLPFPRGRGYSWFAGEAAESRAVRKYLRDRGWDRRQYDITGYWRFDSATWDARFAAVGHQVFAVYERALAEGKGAKVAAEEYDDALERLGL
ncbi:siderophore-interacting protein [Mycolicibacterium sp. F2034L]|uniref:siderophore-interacting protein n=1 Tax=Mycolicibacterium sp. F2034L TaxID=2926422 RepID=UPI001FF20864|nr:siderophore-interacting protein [Mycolicibacterium sp. F2034L]MCK0174276.1 siderophore-interacting protein [Mycolicibacterium sp. F2034L]